LIAACERLFFSGNVPSTIDPLAARPEDPLINHGRSFGGCETFDNAGFRRPRAHSGKKNGIPLASSITNSAYYRTVTKGSMASLLAQLL